jgi:hypothetical protein
MKLIQIKKPYIFKLYIFDFVNFLASSTKGEFINFIWIKNRIFLFFFLRNYDMHTGRQLDT